MVWGYMSFNGLGKLIFIEGNVNSTKYQEILQEGLIPDLTGHLKNTNKIFQQDLAPGHNSKSSQTWFKKHKIDVLPWSGNSPDLNPIENVWRDLKFKIRSCKSPPRDKRRFEDYDFGFLDKLSKNKMPKIV